MNYTILVVMYKVEWEDISEMQILKSDFKWKYLYNLCFFIFCLKHMYHIHIDINIYISLIHINCVEKYKKKTLLKIKMVFW